MIGIYILTCLITGLRYIGKAIDIEKRLKQHWRAGDDTAIHRVIRKYGKDNFHVIKIAYPNATTAELNEKERFWIKAFDTYRNGYNQTWGGDGLDSETARSNALRMIENGTHNFLDSEAARERALRMIENGTHPFLDGKIAQETSRRRVKEGTHHFCDSEWQRQVQHQRVENGTHHFQSKAFYSRRSFNLRLKIKDERRAYYRYTSAILTSVHVIEERLYRMRVREGFFDKEIPDTSQAEQQSLF